MKELPLIVEPGTVYELTRDHFTPRCIGKALGWSRKQINDSDNIQLLSPRRHHAKDQTTPWELQCVVERGGGKTIWEHFNEQVILRNGNPLA